MVIKKQVLFLLGDCPGYYVPLMYQVAEQLADQGVTIIAASTSPYYEKYNGIDFSNLGRVYYLSDYLKRPCDKSDLDAISINYWHVYPTYVRDTFFFGRHKNDWDEYKKTALYYKELFSNHNIDLVISEPPSNSFIYLGYAEAKINEKQFLGFMPARIPKHVNVFTDAYGETLLENRLASDTCESKPSGPPDYMLTYKLGNVRDKWYLQIWRMIRYVRLRSIETNNTSFHQLKSMYIKYIWRKIQYLRVKAASVFSNDFESGDRINIFFPLHYRPEASTSVLARYYEDDLELLKNIAFSLPDNAQLIVKEHLAATGMRNVSFYKKVLSFPNTVLIGPDFNFLKQINRFDAAIVLTSTVGFEAIQNGIPVFLLGRTFYSNYPGVTKIESFSQLEDVLQNLKKNSALPNENIMRHYRRHCFQGQFSYMSAQVLSATNVVNLMVPVMQALTSRIDQENN